MKRDNLRISEGIKYTGEALDGLPHGKGTMTYPDGQVYVGEFKDGNCHGQGTMTNPNGCSYVGEFYENTRMGHGTEIFPNGAKYVGEFKDNMPHGKGTMTYPDKGPDNEFGWATCEGEWKEGMQNGQGTLLYLDGITSYVGQWKDGMFDGPGKFIDQFDIHDGIYKEDRFWEGNEYNSDNGNLEGTYIDGVYHRTEIAIDRREFLDEDGGETYVGEWKDDLFHGQGTYTYPDKSTYEGEWKEGKKHGQGTQTVSTDDVPPPDDGELVKKTEWVKYVGEWRDGEEWEGTLSTDDGTVLSTYSEGVETEN